MEIKIYIFCIYLPINDKTSKIVLLKSEDLYVKSISK